MKLTFRQILSRPDREGRCRIVLDVADAGARYKLPTGASCHPDHFNPAARRVVSPKDPDSARLNALLAGLLAKVEKAALTAAATETPFAPPTPKPKPAQVAAKPLTAAEFYAAWKADNPGQPANSARRYKQVVAHLEAYRPSWPLATLTRTDFLHYLQHLAGLGLTDATASKHVKFLREAFRLADKAVPGWLKLRARYGRAPALTVAELRQLLALPLFEQPALEAERDAFLFQTLLLLRDSDLRALRPHHVAPVELPGAGLVPVLTFHQRKTGDEVRLPLPPQAAAIWHRHGGQLPVLVQQYRNRHMKQLMERAGLTRPFVRVRYVAGEAVEEVVPLWQVVTTHTARHTGAALLVLGSGGDQTLKEIALGHTSASVYGYDTLERYGPLLLQAWAAAGLGASPTIAPGPAETWRQVAASSGETVRPARRSTAAV